MILTKGGAWLGAVRNWIKWNCPNGEFVTWGTDDKLEGTFTVNKLEDLASRVAEASEREKDEAEGRADHLRKVNLDLEAEIYLLKKKNSALEKQLKGNKED